MRHQAVSRSPQNAPLDPVGDLARQIARLVRHPSYARDEVVSSLLLRFLPSGLHPAQGADDLRRRLDAAALDQRALDYLRDNVAAELAVAQARG